MPIRILIADDHAMFRSGVKTLLEQEKEMLVVGETENGPGTIGAVRHEDVDVLLLDLSMPGMHGAQVAETVLKFKPKLGIIVVTMHEDEYYLKELFGLGVRGFVLKRSRPADLANAVRTVARGETYVDSHMSGSAVAWFAVRPTKRDQELTPLTGREQSVCSLLALGHTNAEIADRLHISERTVESHRANIMTKLRIDSRAELVRFAIDHGLMPGPSTSR